MVRVRHHDVIEHLGNPAVLTVVVCCFCPFYDGVCAAHVVHVFRCRSRRGQGVQMRGMTVEEAEVSVEHRLGIYPQGAVVVSVIELRVQVVRQCQLLGNLVGCVTVVRQAQGLIVDVLVKVSLFREIVDRRLAPPGGPVMAGKFHLEPIAEQFYGLVQLARPGKRIADLGAARGIQIVQMVGGNLRHAQCLELREVEDKLGGCLGAHGHLEFDLNAVYDAGLARRLDNIVGYDEAGGAKGQGRSKATGHETRG